MALSPAEKQRRRRQREARSEFVYPAPLTDDIVAGLEQLGWIRPGEAFKRECVGEAVAIIVREVVKAKISLPVTLE